MINVLEPQFSWGFQPNLEAFRCHIYSMPWNFFPSILILYHQSVNNRCMFCFISRNIWNSCTYLVFFVERIFFIWSHMSFFFFHILCLATYFHLNISGHEFVKWIIGLPSNNVSLSNWLCSFLGVSLLYYLRDVWHPFREVFKSFLNNQLLWPDTNLAVQTFSNKTINN